MPEKITIDKSGVNRAAIVGMCTDSGVDIGLRQSKYINNLVEQDHRAIKRIVRPMLGFKSFHCARAILAGIETMHMIKKGQLDRPKARASSAAHRLIVGRSPAPFGLTLLLRQNPTGLYDRRADQVSLDEVERIVIQDEFCMTTDADG